MSIVLSDVRIWIAWYLGMPSLNKLVWVAAQLIYQNYQTEGTSIDSCPLVQDRQTDVILEIPVLVLLVLNFLFLIWVIIVSVIKWSSSLIVFSAFPKDCCRKAQSTNCPGPREETLQSCKGTNISFCYECLIEILNIISEISNIKRFFSFKWRLLSKYISISEQDFI